MESSVRQQKQQSLNNQQEQIHSHEQPLHRFFSLKRQHMFPRSPCSYVHLGKTSYGAADFHSYDFSNLWPILQPYLRRQGMLLSGKISYCSHYAAYSTTAHIISPVFKSHIVLTPLSTEKAKFMFPLDLIHNLSFSYLISFIVGSSAHAA